MPENRECKLSSIRTLRNELKVFFVLSTIHTAQVSYGYFVFWGDVIKLERRKIPRSVINNFESKSNKNMKKLQNFRPKEVQLEEKYFATIPLWAVLAGIIVIIKF